MLTLFLLSSDLGRKQAWSSAEKLLIELTAPFQKIISRTAGFTQGIWLKYFYLVNLHEENARLEKEIAKLRLERTRYLDLLATNRRLQRLLKFKETINYPVLAVQVIGRDPSGWFKSVIIDKGSDSGLKVNMPVVNAHGVVGRLVSVSPNYAKVLLIIDQNSAVDCIIQRSRERGIVKGGASKLCRLDYVIKTGDVVPGDMVITSGLGGVFPKGIPVGQVLTVKSMPGELFKDIIVKPFVDFSKLEELLLILKEGSLSDDQSGS